MEVIKIIFLIILCLGIIAFFIFVGFLALFWLPIIAGIVGTVTLWRSGHDNIAVIVLIISIVGQVAWYCAMRVYGESSGEE